MSDLTAVIYDDSYLVGQVEEQLPSTYYGDLENYIINLIRANQPPAGATTETGQLFSSLSALFVVVKNSSNQLVLCDLSQPLHIVGVLGVLLQAGQGGDTVSYQTAGELVDQSWNWQPGKPIFVSLTGTLTQVVPINFPLVAMGWAIDSNRMNIQIFERIMRS